MARLLLRRSGAAWLELLLALAIVMLLLQLLPAASSRVLAALDIRDWSRATWFLANIGVLLLLVVVRFGPDLIDSLWQRSTPQNSGAATPSPAPRFQPREDPRVLMRRDEQLRAKLRRKLALYCLVIPAVVLGAGICLAWFRSETEKTHRAQNTFLAENAGNQFEDKTNGVVGLQFRVRSDRDLRVTHLGVYDSKSDGLQLAHRVGIFQTRSRTASKNDLVCEAIVPFGQEAPLESGYRWVTLDRPVALRSGETYILAAESFAETGDDWPRTFDEKSIDRNSGGQAWNPLVVGEHSSKAAELLLTMQPWPAVPNQRLQTKAAIPHGFANLIIADDQ